MDLKPGKILDVKKYENLMNIWNCFVCKKCPVYPKKISKCLHVFCSACIFDLSKCPKCDCTFERSDISRCILTSNYVTLRENILKLATQSSQTDVISEANSDEVKGIQNNVLELRHDEVESTNLDNKSADQQNKIDLKENKTQKVEIEDKTLFFDKTRATTSFLRKNKPVKDFQAIQPEKKEIHNLYEKHYSPVIENNPRKANVKPKVNKLKLKKSNTKDLKQDSTKENSFCVDSNKSKCENNVDFTTPKRPPVSTKEMLSSPRREQNKKGETPLHAAVVKANIIRVKQLLQSGANPNVKDFAGWTPLTDAVAKSNIELVKLLLDNGAWVNTPAVLNTTALLEAVLNKNFEIVLLLLDHGADPNMRSSLGITPLSLAETLDAKIHQLLVERRINFQPEHIVMPFCPEKIPVIFCDVPEDLRENILELCRDLNFKVRNTDFSQDDVTYILAKTDDKLNCPFSTNILHGILAGINIVSVDWLKECHKQKHVIPIDNFEVQGTEQYPNTGVPKKSRLNTYRMMPRLFQGSHISLLEIGAWNNMPGLTKEEIIKLISNSGAVYQIRNPDPENIPTDENIEMFHTDKTSCMEILSHIILYKPEFDLKKEPFLKYNMTHVKTLSTAWFFKCIQTFSICDSD